MQDARKVIRLNEMLQESNGILTYDFIQFSDEFQDKTGETCRRLLSKLHAKHKTALTPLYVVLYKDDENDFYKSVILDEQNTKEMVKTGSVIDIHYFAVYDAKQYKDSYSVIERASQKMVNYLDSVKQKETRDLTRSILTDATKPLKKINVSADDTVNQAHDMARNLHKEKKSRVTSRGKKSPSAGKSKTKR